MFGKRPVMLLVKVPVPVPLDVFVVSETVGIVGETAQQTPLAITLLAPLLVI